MIVKDSNGTPLQDGDSVTLIKDLKVKGTSVTLERGTLIKNIRQRMKSNAYDARHEKTERRGIQAYMYLERAFRCGNAIVISHRR